MSAFSVQIQDSEALVVSCESGETLLRAALKQGLGFPYECASGGCGSCAFELVEGEVKELWEEAPGLSPRAKKRGRYLACQCVPQSDLVIKAPLDEAYISPVIPIKTQVTLAQTTPLTDDMVEFCFRAEPPANFIAGQFSLLDIPGVEGQRAYSMSNLPNEEGEWKFVIKRVPEGSATGILFDQFLPVDQFSPGDSITLDGPYGVSYLRPERPRDIVCIAGGSGLSPVLSILQAAVQAPELNDKKLVLFYGGRTPKDLCVEELIQSNPALASRVEVHTAISEEGFPEWKGERGFIHELLEKKLDKPLTDYEYYFCGPSPMTDAVHRMLLLEHKAPLQQLHFDRFV